jgi:plastocyanin
MTSHRLAWRPIIVAVAAAVAVLALAACGSSASSGASSTPSAASTAGGSAAAITIQNFAFTPQTLTVKAGTTVTWTNNDSAPHTVTSADGISTSANTTSLFNGSVNAGATFSHTFTKAGTYYYLCTIHKSQAGMHGEIIVQ